MFTNWPIPQDDHILEIKTQKQEFNELINSYYTNLNTFNLSEFYIEMNRVLNLCRVTIDVQKTYEYRMCDSKHSFRDNERQFKIFYNTLEHKINLILFDLILYTSVVYELTFIEAAETILQLYLSTSYMSLLHFQKLIKCECNTNNVCLFQLVTFPCDIEQQKSISPHIDTKYMSRVMKNTFKIMMHITEYYIQRKLLIDDDMIKIFNAVSFKRSDNDVVHIMQVDSLLISILDKYHLELVTKIFCKYPKLEKCNSFIRYNLS